MSNEKKETEKKPIEHYSMKDEMVHKIVSDSLKQNWLLGIITVIMGIIAIALIIYIYAVVIIPNK